MNSAIANYLVVVSQSAAHAPAGRFVGRAQFGAHLTGRVQIAPDQRRFGDAHIDGAASGGGSRGGGGGAGGGSGSGAGGAGTAQQLAEAQEARGVAVGLAAVLQHQVDELQPVLRQADLERRHVQTVVGHQVHGADQILFRLQHAPNGTKLEPSRTRTKFDSGSDKDSLSLFPLQ